jgi:hypothetical protein
MMEVESVLETLCFYNQNGNMSKVGVSAGPDLWGSDRSGRSEASTKQKQNPQLLLTHLLL